MTINAIAVCGITFRASRRHSARSRAQVSLRAVPDIPLHLIQRVRVRRISLASRRAATRLGLGTASRFRLLAKHRSGVRFSTRSARALRCTRTTFAALTFVRVRRIELRSLPWQGSVLPLNHARFLVNYHHQRPLLINGPVSAHILISTCARAPHSARIIPLSVGHSNASLFF